MYTYVHTIGFIHTTHAQRRASLARLARSEYSASPFFLSRQVIMYIECAISRCVSIAIDRNSSKSVSIRARHTFALLIVLCLFSVDTLLDKVYKHMFIRAYDDTHTYTHTYDVK